MDAMADAPGPSRSRPPSTSPPSRSPVPSNPHSPRGSSQKLRLTDEQEPPGYSSSSSYAPPAAEPLKGSFSSEDHPDGVYPNGHARDSYHDSTRESRDVSGVDRSDAASIATVEQKKALWWKNVAVTGGFIASWYGFATLLSLYNKWMFTPKYYNFPFPLFVTTCHFVIQYILSAIILNVWPKRFKPIERPTRKDYVSKIFPAAASTGGDIGLSNLSLKIITLSLYTMAKSSTLLFVLFFAFTFRIEKPSVRLVAVICLISFGVFLMVFNTTSVSIPGLIMVFSASGLAGLRWALTELVMHKKSMGLGNPFATIYWLAPLMAVSLAVVSMIDEGWFNVFASEHLQGMKAILTVGVIIFPGALAFAMVSSEFFIIHRAGSVPLSIAGISKEVTTITISSLVFGDQLTLLNIVGLGITVGGICVYTHHKYQKSISQTVPLGPDGQPLSPVDEDEDQRDARPHMDPEDQPLTSTSPSTYDRVQLNTIQTPRGSESREEQTQRRRDEFEGWNVPGEQWSDTEDDGLEADQEEVQRLRNERDKKVDEVEPGGWGPWWDKKM